MTVLAGRYHLGELIASGGMATVHRAVDNVLKRPVAVKVAAPEHLTNCDALRQEALSAARLSHPNVARIFDYGEVERGGRYLPFVVMELIPGGTLSTRLIKNGPIPWRDAARLCADVAFALAAAHDRGLVHRDIKPGNIMLSPTGAKVVDFGVSAPAGAATADDDGRIWGTPAYFAPEQLRGAPAGPAADVYAVGLVLHACLTGRSAWNGRGTFDVLAARALSPIPRLPETCDVPPQIRSLHRRCLAPVPKKRLPARRLAHLLSEASTSASSDSHGSSDRGRIRDRRRRRH